MNKKAAIFFIVIGIVALVCIIYLISAFTGSGDNKPTSIVFNAFSKKGEVYTKKTDAYDAMQKDSMLKVKEENINIDFSAFSKNDKGSAGTSKEKNAQVNTQQTNPVVQNTAPRIIVKYINKNPEPTEAPKKQKQYGFTEYLTDAKTNVKDTITLSPGNTNFVPAFLEEDTKVTDNASIVFILNKDQSFNGVTFKRMSIMYGVAKAMNTYFDINVYQVLNSDNGQKYPVSLILYNENYSRGIKYEGNFNKAVKDESTEAVDRTNLPVTSPNYYVSTASDIVKGTVRKLKKDYSIALTKNYKCYFIEIK